MSVNSNENYRRYNFQAFANISRNFKFLENSQPSLYILTLWALWSARELCTQSTSVSVRWCWLGQSNSYIQARYCLLSLCWYNSLLSTRPVDSFWELFVWKFAQNNVYKYSIIRAKTISTELIENLITGCELHLAAQLHKHFLSHKPSKLGQTGLVLVCDQQVRACRITSLYMERSWFVPPRLTHFHTDRQLFTSCTISSTQPSELEIKC